MSTEPDARPPTDPEQRERWLLRYWDNDLTESELAGLNEALANQPKLRAAFGLMDGEPTFDETFLELLRWSADYYRHPIGEVMATALPVPLRQGAALFAEEVRWRVTPLGRESGVTSLLARAHQMRAAF